MLTSLLSRKVEFLHSILCIWEVLPPLVSLAVSYDPFPVPAESRDLSLGFKIF